MQKISHIALLMLLSLTLGGCPNIGDPTGDSEITVVNNSDKTVYFTFDTSIAIWKYNPFSGPNIRPIKPFRSIEIWNFHLDFLKTFGYDRLFFFDKAVVDSVPWDTIRANNMYLKRIDFTKATLDSLNWTLTYP